MKIDVTKLKGDAVYIGLLQPLHREVIRPLAKDKRIWEFNQMLLVNESYDEQFDRYFDTALDPFALGGQQSLVIHDTGNAAIIGMTRLYEMHPKDKRLVIGYTWFLPTVWGKPHNKECKLLLLQYVFETWGWNRVEFQVAHQNVRSQKALEKIGAVKEGVLRKHGYRNDGSIRDSVIFSIINDEWPSKKEKLQQLIVQS